MNTPSDFIELKTLDEDEIYSHDETRYALSWGGYPLSITEKDIEHLKAGKPLMLVVNYWQTINLYTTLKQARMEISFEDAKSEALVNFGNPDKLKHMLEEAINSPNPKHHFPESKLPI